MNEYLVKTEFGDGPITIRAECYEVDGGVLKLYKDTDGTDTVGAFAPSAWLSVVKKTNHTPPGIAITCGDCGGSLKFVGHGDSRFIFCEDPKCSSWGVSHDFLGTILRVFREKQQA